MGLLHKRPLALFCLCFLVGLYGAFSISSTGKIICFSISGVLFAVLLLLSCLHKEWRVRWIALSLCMLSVVFAFLHAYTRVDRRMEEALAYTGTRTVECQILSVLHTDSWHTECEAALLQIGEERTNIRVYLICGFPTELYAGDRILARVELIEPDEEAYGIRADEQVNRTRILLAAVLHESNDARLLRRMDNEPLWRLLWEENGIELASDRMQAATAFWFDRIFGEESAPLARSFFIGDQSALSARAVRDFRRTGTSHLLAVSGLHIAILLGGLEWLLRRLTLPKSVRIFSVSIAGFLLLMVTGFSMSACRSVLMLFAVYLQYLLAKENDSITSLLVAVSLIVILSADAFFDLGLWMSFFATLGLVSVYPLFDAKISKKPFSSRGLQLLWRILRFAIMTVLMSLISGLFLLPIQWLVFREISLCTIPANLVMAPLGIGYLYLIPIALLLSPIPILSTLACDLLWWIGQVMTSVLSFFSEQNFAMLSLRYSFAGVLVMLFAVSMLTLLLIRLRHKWLLILPSVAAIACFAVCLSVTYHVEPALVSDYTNGKQRMFFVTDNGESVMIDLSCQSTSGYFDGAATMRKQAATDIDGLVLGHLSEEHPQMLEQFLPYTVVHRVYLPKILAEKNPNLAREIGFIAEEAGCEVLLYNENVAFSPLPSFGMQVCLGEGNTVSALTLDCDGRRLSFADPARISDADKTAWQPFLESSHTLFLSCSSREHCALDFVHLHGESTKQIVLSHSHAHTCIFSREGSPAVYCYPFDGKKRILSFFLEP